MVDITRLERILPHTGIEVDDIASIRGFGSRYGMSLYQPMVGQAEPLLCIVDAVKELLVWSGKDDACATERAKVAHSEIPPRLALELRVWCISLYEEMLCAPVSAICEWLDDQHPECGDATEFIRRCSAVAIDLPVFGLGEYGWKLRSFAELPDSVLASGMCEFFCSLRSTMIYSYGHGAEIGGEVLAAEWKNALPSRTADLVRQVGGELFHFADPDDLFDDDLVHRYLALDYACHMAPESGFVRHLLAVSGARSIEELRHALLNPAIYPAGFKLCDFADFVEARPWVRFEFGAAAQRRIAMIPGEIDTLRHAASLVRTRIDGALIFITDDDAALDMLVAAAELSGATWEHCSLSGLTSAKEREMFSNVTEVWAVRSLSSDPEGGVPSPLERRQLGLLAHATELGVAAEWWDAGGCRSGSLDQAISSITRLPRTYLFREAWLDGGGLAGRRTMIVTVM